MAWKTLVCVCSLALFPACVDDDIDPAMDDPAAGETMGSLSLEWSIEAAGSLISCPDVGASEISIVATSSEAEFTETLSCFGGLGETNALPAGDYQVEVRLVDSEGGVLDNVGMGQVSIEAGHVAPLGEINFSM